MRRSFGYACAVCLGLVAIAAFALAGCSRPEPVTLHDDDSGQTVRISPGRQIVVTLTSNPTTGYNWSVVACPAGLRQVGDSKYTDPQTSRVGASGTESFTFAADKRGAGQLILEYRRPWEKDTPPARTWSVVVSIE